MNALLLGLLTAMLFGDVTAIGLFVVALLERRARLVPRVDRPELAPPRAPWGGGLVHPPARSATARALAGLARLVRSDSRVQDHQAGLRFAARMLGTSALLLALALLPLVQIPPSAADPEVSSLLPLDLENGLLAIGLLLLVNALARIAAGLSERSAWSRIGSARQASRGIASIVLLTLVVAPLALDAGSLRLHDIVLDQTRSLAVIDALLSQLQVLFAWPWLAELKSVALPAWNLFAQPLTAALFLPAISMLLSSPRVDDPRHGSISLAGLGLDADPRDLYWLRVDDRLSKVLAAGLFVTLFLGAGHLPFFDPAKAVEMARPYLGEAVPIFALGALCLVVFLAKLALVLVLGTRFGRLVARSRDDRSLRLATRRLLPLAWANLLLVAAIQLALANQGIGVTG